MSEDRMQFGLLEILSGILVILKLNGQINWSWWIVLAPIWVPFVSVLTFFVMAALGVFGPI